MIFELNAKEMTAVCGGLENVMPLPALSLKMAGPNSVTVKVDLRGAQGLGMLQAAGQYRRPARRKK